MKHAGALVLGCLALVLMTGCPFESEVPLGSPGPGSLDPQLAGRWVGDESSDATAEVDFLPFGPDQYYVELREKGKAPERFRAFTVRVGGQPFLNVVELKADAARHPFYFLRYSVRPDGALALRFLGDKAVPKALASDQQALAKFVEGHLDGAFLDDSEKPALLFRSGPAKGVKAAKPEEAGKPHVAIPIVAPRAGDVATIDGMIRAWYEVVSGPAGQPRDWGRDRTLYMPDLRFVTVAAAAAPGAARGQPSVRIQDHQAYVDSADPGLTKGFFEREIHRVMRRFGPIAHAWSTYESRSTESGPVTARGINSIELYWDGQRWWISSGSWTEETKESPIPPEYLPTAK